MKRSYRSTQQAVIGWTLAAAMVVGGVIVLLLPTARHHGGYVIAPVALITAVICARFARSGVDVTGTGVRVTGVFSTTEMEWEEIREFKLSPFGASVVGLKDGRWIGLTGIEQTNLAWLRKITDTPERRMIDELNEILREHAGEGAGSPRS